MLIENLVLYKDKYYIQVNEDTDTLFYFFDYDVRSSDINMQFQHFHTFYEICIMLCHDSMLFLEGTPHRLQPLDIVGVPPNVLHKTQYPAGEPCQRIIIQFNMPKKVTGLSDEYEQLLGLFHQDLPFYRFERELQEKLYRKLNEIYHLAQKTDPMRNLIIHQKFIEFLTLMYLNRDKNQYLNDSAMSAMEERIYAVTSFIHAHYSEDISLEQLAEQFDISTSYLSHQFKQVTGFTVTDYIQMTRIRNVQAMLINTDTPITEVAAPCGFNSFSQFNRVFRKHIGMSPSQFRKKHRLQDTIFDT